MPAEIHKQILDYQGGDANAALELVEKFKPLIKRYAFFLHREDSFEDLQCFLLSMLKTWDTSRLSSTDDATVTRYIANSVKNEYIALSKQKAKERGTSYLEDATLPQALEYAQKTSTCDQYDQLTLQDLHKVLNEYEFAIVYALKTTHNPSGYEYLRCSKRADHKGCPGCGTLRKNEFEQFIFTAMGEKFREFKLLRGGEGKVNPKITTYQVELAQVEAEIEKLLDTLTGANATLLAYANKKIEDLDNRRKTLSKAIADLSVETLSSQQIELLSGYLDDWENISFEDKRKAADGLISSISATSDYVKIEWKI